MVTATKEVFIQGSGTVERLWVFHNLGPAKIVIYGGQSGNLATQPLRAGDYVELQCITAEVALASNESYDAAILQWVPAS